MAGLGYCAGGLTVICCLVSAGYMGGGGLACFCGGRCNFCTCAGLLGDGPFEGVAGAGRGLSLCGVVEEKAVCTQSFAIHYILQRCH